MSTHLDCPESVWLLAASAIFSHKIYKFVTSLPQGALFKPCSKTVKFHTLWCLELKTFSAGKLEAMCIILITRPLLEVKRLQIPLLKTNFNIIVEIFRPRSEYISNIFSIMVPFVTEYSSKSVERIVTSFPLDNVEWLVEKLYLQQQHCSKKNKNHQPLRIVWSQSDVMSCDRIS